MTNFNQIFIFSALLLSCSSAKNMNEINKDFTIISAEKSIWFGGRDGVKGTLYKFILKNNQNKTFRFTNLKIGSNKYPIRTAEL
jgi:archaellum component FlaG (FlaF/FlaG flagellin family)